MTWRVRLPPNRGTALAVELEWGQLARYSVLSVAHPLQPIVSLARAQDP